MSSKKDNLPEKFDIDMTPLRDFMKQMDSFFNQSFKQINPYFHLKPFWVDVYENDSNVIVTADLPDYKRDQINLEIIENRLRITVDKSTHIKDIQNNSSNIKDSFQRMERMITVPFPIPKKETKASFKDGRLKVTIPKKDSQTYIDIEE
ncbi:Hsp20/alpha crystallin family protein [Virgibacillus byunsanensis]|uniref:Hsp20/alpha crystallin family protein n=1 Tax=Virgibacillus byunsanensis TaxID=570945 RepID=A0ABW3LMM0_9BACI